MRRISLVLTGFTACAVLAFGGTTAAKSGSKTCTTHSKNVIGKAVKGTLTASNVDSAQRQYATCAYAKKVINEVTSVRIEEPRVVAAFYCVPKVLSTDPDLVRYRCTFKGADTPMFVKLVFKVKYNLD